MTPAPSQPALRVGVMGGAFDPPHRAHLALARAAIEQLKLDVLHVLPTGQAWHKPRALTDAAHRLAMTQAAFADWPQVRVDDRELRRPGPSYTVDTLRELGDVYGGDAPLHLILGADQALALATWRQPEEVLRLAILCVASRADESSTGAPFDAELLGRQGWLHARVVPLRMTPIHLSSSAIRAALSAGRLPPDALPQAVTRYIATHHLYHPTHDSHP